MYLHSPLYTASAAVVPVVDIRIFFDRNEAQCVYCLRRHVKDVMSRVFADHAAILVNKLDRVCAKGAYQLADAGLAA